MHPQAAVLTRACRHAIEYLDGLEQSPTAFFSGTLWRGRRAMRISVVNWRTSDADVRMTVQAVGRVLSQMSPAI